MTFRARLVLLGGLMGFAASSSTQAAYAAGTATIVLEVSTFRNVKGLLGCQLYAKSDDFPDNWAAEMSLRKVVAVTATTTSCTYADMPPGTYAAAIIHDENSNGKLDKNFLGVPTEGYGISNNHTHALKRPTWDESKFEVNAGTTVTSHISIRY